MGAYVKDSSFIGGWEQVCSVNLASAFFAQVVVLVEGPDDQAVLESILERPGSGWPAEADVVVAPVAGKGFFFAPQAILAELGIPVVAISDSDSGMRSRMEANGKDEKDIVAAVAQAARYNRDLQAYFGRPPVDIVDWPVGACVPRLFFWEDHLESALKNDWPSWFAARDDLVLKGNGVMKKNAPTYRHAAARASEEPTGEFARLINFLKVELLNAPQASQSSEKDATRRIPA